jgi:colanic acid/amylovoran biosynthesis glycosyltransferase
MSRLLRVGVFVGAFPVVSETFILRQITGLLDLGHDVHIFANARAEDGVLHEAIARHRLLERTSYVDGPPESVLWEMPVTPLRERTWPPGFEHSVANSTRLARAFPALARCALAAPRVTRSLLDPREYSYRARSLSGIYRLRTLLNTGIRFDVLHAHFGPVGNCFRFARELWRAPLVVSFHGYDFSTQPRKEGAGMYEKLFQTADLITVNSNYTRGRVERLGCAPDRMRVLPMGVDPCEFPFRERMRSAGQCFRVLTVARLVEIKGLEFSLRAVAKLRETTPNVRYDIIGDGPLRAKLEALTKELNLGDAVAFHGSRESSYVKQFMGEAHAFVLASVTVEGDEEGQGLVLQEAQCSGLPVIATRHGAFPEGMRADESGFLVAERDPGALAERLQFLAEHAGAAREMGKAGRKLMEEKFDVRRLNLQLVELYTTTIDHYHH